MATDNTLTDKIMSILGSAEAHDRIAAVQRQGVIDAEAASRQKIVDEIAADEAAATKEMARLAPAIAAAIRDEAAAAAVADAKRDIRVRLENQRMDLSMSTSSRRATRQTQLRKTLPADAQTLLDGAWSDFQILWDQARRQGATEERPTGSFFRVTGKPEVEIWSNRTSLEARLARIRDAQFAICETLPLEIDVSVDALRKRIQELRAGLPPVVMKLVPAADEPIEPAAPAISRRFGQDRAIGARA